jgi:DNA-directed RNA polymerase specialized sigma24 family protein
VARRPEDAALRRLQGFGVAPEAVLSAVAEAAGVGIEELSRRRRESPLKAMTLFLLARHTGLTQREIAPLLGLTSGASVSWQIRRIPEMFKQDPGLERLAVKAEHRIGRNM